MKTIVLISITIVLMLSFAGYVYWWLSSYTSDLAEAMEELYHKLDSNVSAAFTDMKTIREYWEENQNLLYYVIDHTEIDAIHLRMLRAEEWLRQGNSEEAAVEIRELHHLLYYLPKTQGLNMEGIL